MDTRGEEFAPLPHRPTLHPSGHFLSPSAEPARGRGVEKKGGFIDGTGPSAVYDGYPASSRRVAPWTEGSGACGAVGTAAPVRKGA